MEETFNVDFGGQDPKNLFNGLLCVSSELREPNKDASWLKAYEADPTGKDKFVALVQKVLSASLRLDCHSGGYDQASATLSNKDGNGYINIDSKGITFNNVKDLDKASKQRMVKAVFQICKAFGFYLDKVKVPADLLTEAEQNQLKSEVKKDNTLPVVFAPAPATPGFKIKFDVGNPAVHSAEQIERKWQHNYSGPEQEALTRVLDTFGNIKTLARVNPQKDKVYDQPPYAIGNTNKDGKATFVVDLHKTDGEISFELPEDKKSDAAFVTNYVRAIVATCKVLGIDVNTLNFENNLPDGLKEAAAKAFANAKEEAKDNKTDIGKLQPLPLAPIFEPFKLVFKDKTHTDGLNTEQQAKAILDKARELHKRGHQKVGITYSANYGQTKKIRQTYAEGKWNTGTGGSNQAEVLAKVEELLANEYKDLQKVFHILPITTMEGYDADGKYGNTTLGDILKNDRKEIETFLNNGHAVLGWQNQYSNSDNKDGFTYAVGGGVATKKEGGITEEQRKKVCGTLNEFATNYPAPKHKSDAGIKVEGKNRNAFGIKINRQLAANAEKINEALAHHKTGYVFTPAAKDGEHHRLHNKDTNRTIEVEDNGDFVGEEIKLNELTDEAKTKKAAELLAADMKASIITLVAAGVKEPYDFSLTGIKPQTQQEIDALKKLKDAVYADVQQWLQETYPDNIDNFTVGNKAIPKPEAKSGKAPKS